MKKGWILLLVLCSSLAAAPYAVVFNFGGVLTTKRPSSLPVRDFLAQVLNLPATEIKLLQQESITSGLSQQAFWEHQATLRGKTLPEEWKETFTHIFLDAMSINPLMYLLVATLKEKGVVTALISNIDGYNAHVLAEYGWYQPFDPAYSPAKLASNNCN